MQTGRPTIDDPLPESSAMRGAFHASQPHTPAGVSTVTVAMGHSGYRSNSTRPQAVRGDEHRP